MDNLTHTLAGAALGQAGLKRFSGLGTATLLIAANLPDIDALVIPFGGDTLTARRGWTHGPLAIVVLPALLTIALVALDNLQLRRGTRPLDRSVVRPWHLYLLALVAAISHPLLDWLNTYGVRLLMPFSDRWFYGDTLQIIDPWVWLVLGLGVLLSRRRERAHSAASTRPARIALGLIAAYIALMLVGSRWARAVTLESLEATRAAPAQRVLAGPVFVNSLRRALIIDEGENYRFGTVDLRPQPLVRMRDGALATNLYHPLALAAREREEIRAFLYWSRFPYFVLPPDTTGSVEVRDARFRGDRRGWRNPFHRRVPVSELRRGTQRSP